MLATSLLAAAVLAQFTQAQFPPPREGIKTVRSKHHDGITISYKNPGICETTPGVKSYSGYVHLPPNSLNEEGEDQNYPINTFFWFIESRKDPHHAPLSIWLNGGPGGSSLLGMLSENGPCAINADSNSSTLNPWSWNNEVNVLYIDQPVQVGFSYDTLNNGTYNLLAMDLDDFADGVPETNSTFYVGTFASQNATRTANSTEHAAVALWHFAQTWFEEFPKYKPHDEKISLWAESYGGHYGPKIMDFFHKQNKKIDDGEISGPGTHYLHLDTLGLVNACIDNLVQDESYSTFAWNNTYGVKAVNETIKHKQLYELHRPGGILDQIRECQRLNKALSAADGPELDVGYVESYCRNVSFFSSDVLIDPYMESGKYGWFDITHPSADAFPLNYHLGWLNEQWVQRALGVPVNFTWVSPIVSQAFVQHGDMARGGFLEGLADLLDNGVKVHLMYGDRDLACNWVGGEQASLAIPHRHQKAFADAGYTALTVSPPDEPPFVPYGLTRQHGNLSFTRVYQAGHMVPSYQPEASLRMFERALFNKDIATGTVDLRATGGWKSDVDIFKTEGPRDTWWKKNELMPVPKAQCYILQAMTCTKEEMEALRKGTAIVEDYILVGIKGSEEQIAVKGENSGYEGVYGSEEQKIVVGEDEL
ncbi:Alpha/Beta hydrolase protein [Diaporthe sp. PMI_573]|nr:Alpha/Beta hydrolase protein [Diaporthaceae sp. PMI_573]